MSEWAQVLEAYQTSNPAGWVGVYRFLPIYAGILLAGLGVVLLLFGGGRAFRVVAGPMGALVGLLWAPVVFDKLGLTLAPKVVSTISAAGLGAMGFLFPPGAVFFAFGLPVGFLAGQLAGQSDWLLGFVPGFLVTGMVAAVFHRHIGAVASSLAGGWILAIGLLATLHMVPGLPEAVAAQPWGVIVAAVLFGVAGSVYQLAARPPPDEAERMKLEKRRAKRTEAEKKALEERWANYSSRRGIE